MPDHFLAGSEARPALWARDVARAAAAAPASQPDPNRHDHALYSVTVTGFSAKDVGETWGKGELFVDVAGFPRTALIKAAKDEWVSVKEPRPFTLSHAELDPSAGTVTLRFELYDYDPMSSNDLLGAFEARVKLDELARAGQLDVDLQSSNGNAKAKASGIL